MKKLFAIILILCLLPIAALACEETMPPAEETNAVPLPKIEISIETLTGYAWVPIDETRHFAGKWDPGAQEEILNATSEETPYVLGILDNGVVRAKGEIIYIEIDGVVLGLTKLEVSIDIREGYGPLLAQIVKGATGEELSAASVMAAAECRTAKTIWLKFFLPETPKVPVATVRMNGGRSAATLYAGEYAGKLSVGFVTGGMPYQPPEETAEPEPEATEETEPAATPEPVVIRETVYYRETVVRETVKEPTCVKIVQNNFQTIVNSTVKNVQKVVLSGGGGCGGKNVHCLED